MSGVTSYLYQDGTPSTAVRIEDSTANISANAAARHEENPNSRLQFDNTLSMVKTGWGGDHLSRAASNSRDCISTTATTS